MKIQILAFTSLVISMHSFALETDNYLMWNRELKDSASKINSFLASEIEAALEKVNNKKKAQDCIDVTNAIAARFMSYFIDKNPLENHLKVTLSSEEIYPKTGDYTKISIYRDPFRFYVPAFGLSPNVMVRGIYFGTDKLTHFSSTGRRYFKHYLKELKSSSDQEAQRSAILFGLRNEASILGYWSSGVFSYGDMEANYQGLLFYKQLCFDEHDSFIVQNPRGDWKLVRKPDIRNYVSPLWDETFNLSYRLPENWVKVAKVLKQDYCSLASEPAVQERMNYYRRFEHTSFSRDFIKELQARGFKDAPIPEATQSFEELCQGPLFSPNI